MRTMVCVAVATTSLFWSCGYQGRSTEIESKRPTATEVFQLRSECVALGQKLFKDRLDDPSDDVGRGKDDEATQMNSHYDLQANRCYVELTSGPWIEVATSESKVSHHLYDGQTGKLLAQSKSVGVGPRYLKSGSIYVEREPLTSNGDKDFKTAEDFIDKTMGDDRDRSQ
jgi:hypothetical protein